MASKKTDPKQKCVTVYGHTKKKPNKRHAITEMLSKAKKTISNDEDKASEMERNFSLFSKRSSVIPEDGMIKEALRDGGSETNKEAIEDDEHDEEKNVGEDTVNDERYPESLSWSDFDADDCDDNEKDNKPFEEGHTSASVEVQKELSTMSFEDIIKLQNKVGIKAYKTIFYGTKKKQQTAEPMKRLSKHRPDEISAKKPVPFLRKVVPVKKTILRDPRFDDLSGEFRPEVFMQTYKFIDEIRQREAQMLKKKLKKVKSNVKREEFKSLLKRMENQERARQRLEQQREMELQFKRKQRKLVGQGHRPFYLKKSEKKKLELAEKYNELKKSGKLENFLSKKRKRNAIKDRRKLPHQHNKN